MENIHHQCLNFLRFPDQFSKLSEFYNKCPNLQYFKYLVQVPTSWWPFSSYSQNDPVIRMEPTRKLSSERSHDSHLQFVELLNNYGHNNLYQTKEAR